MVQKAIKPIPNIVLITALAFAIFIGGAVLLHIVPLTVKNKIANGLLLDFTITFPALYYFIVVRPLKVPAKTVLLVFSLCLITAYFLLPLNQKRYLLNIRKLVTLIEVPFIIYAATRFNKIRTAYKNYQARFADPVFNLRSAMTDVLGNSFSIKLIASELTVLRYGLFLWKKEASALKGSTSFSTHRELGYVAIWCIFLVAVVVEVTAFHFLLLKWSHTAAVIVTALSLYGVVFLIADLSAIKKRKILVGSDCLILRAGLRWTAKTSPSNISSLKKITGDSRSENSCFKGGIIKNSGNLLIAFKQPVTVDKLYGEGKEYSEIWMNVDDFEKFAVLVTAQL